ncbi:hypothetical protein A2Z33_06330 [Candidatus Gottesmanbacteria bacterium RBG_16_52_11]|uniref:Radical SAM core domain-containing protein n=1 Tax=Candidatus Gottesmanbacteria bacterium RBG_16_52_11 TaxID=1798374 RepID=A0A1F5YXG4_9BACT|nr:MAG: hypothetical protein A2Z33_06330 [Candidatus Gottesmanbacteria bacterium RBG_16_52_11]
MNQPFGISEVTAKSALVRCGIPGIDYVINPYIGCRFACKYCYASFMGRFVNKQVSDWGTYVYVKTNLPELLGRELTRLKDKGRGKEIFFSSVTDPYQGIEAKYKLTRNLITVLADYGFGGAVSVLTKSDLVTRDIDVFSRLRSISVGLTVTSADDGISRYFETYAPPVSKRLQALVALNGRGIRTYAFVGPLLPHFVAQPRQLEKIFRNLSDAGTKDIFIEHLNLAPYIRNRLLAEMKGADREIVRKFYNSQTKSYRQDLEGIIRTLVTKYRLRLLADMVIFHKEYQSVPRDNAPAIDRILH